MKVINRSITQQAVFVQKWFLSGFFLADAFKFNKSIQEREDFCNIWNKE